MPTGFSIAVRLATTVLPVMIGSGQVKDDAYSHTGSEGDCLTDDHKGRTEVTKDHACMQAPIASRTAGPASRKKINVQHACMHPSQIVRIAETVVQQSQGGQDGVPSSAKVLEAFVAVRSRGSGRVVSSRSYRVMSSFSFLFLPKDGK